MSSPTWWRSPTIMASSELPLCGWQTPTDPPSLHHFSVRVVWECTRCALNFSIMRASTRREICLISGFLGIPSPPCDSTAFQPIHALEKEPGADKTRCTVGFARARWGRRRQNSDILLAWPEKVKKGLTEGKRQWALLCRGNNNGAQLWAAFEEVPLSVGQLKNPRTQQPQQKALNVREKMRKKMELATAF